MRSPQRRQHWVRYLGGGMVASVLLTVVMFNVASPASAETDLFSQPWNRRAPAMTTVKTTGMPSWVRSVVGLSGQAVSGRLDPVVLRSPLGATAGMSCRLDVASSGLSHASVLVADTKTGKIAVSKNAGKPVLAASTTKIATAVAALRTLGSDTRLQTRVVAGAQPGQVVLVGGGDATLSASAQNWYGSGDGIGDLAAQIGAWSAAHGQPVTSVVVDSGLFSGPAWQESWPENYRTLGVQSPITALSLDGGRQDPTGEYSPRGTDPALAAGQALAQRLGLQPDAVSAGSAPAGADVIARHDSPTVGDQVRFLLAHSDNTLADTLARLVAGKEGQARSFSGITTAYRKVFQTLGLSLSGSHFADGSGLSHHTSVAPKLLVSLLRMSVLSPRAAPVWDYLAVGTDESSTLRGRFTDLSTQLRAQIRAKTGTLEDATALAGTIPAAAGNDTWAFFIAEEQDTNSAQARTGIDRLVSGIAACR